jgi:Flp pilus assembly protein TadG
MGARGWIGNLRRWGADARGVAAIEFALVVPFLLILYFGGYEATEASSAYRKMSDVTVELGEVTAQYTTMSAADVQNVFAASSQIMAPYPTAKLTIVLSEITTNASSNATVTWSQAYQGGSALAVGAPFTLPAGMAAANTSYIFVQTSYTWTPGFQDNFVSNVPMTDQYYMIPRNSASIPYTG